MPRQRRGSSKGKRAGPILRPPQDLRSEDVQASLDPRLSTIVSVLLVAGTFAVYSQVLGHEFIRLDDRTYVTENPTVLAGLSASGVAWAFTTTHASNWHPLTWLSHMLDCQLFGPHAGWHHFTNLLLHCAAVWLLFVVLNRMTKSIWASAFAAALFGVHPLHVESVAWIAERKDVLSTFFGFLTLLAYVRYTERPVAGRYWIMAILLALGLMAKPMLVTWPFVMLLLDYWPLGRFDQVKYEQGGVMQTWWRLIREKLPLIALAAASSVMTILAQKRGGAVASSALIPLDARLSNALITYVCYLGKTVWPAGLAVYYPHSYQAAPGLHTAGAVLLLAVVTAVAIQTRQTRPYLIVGWLWYVGTLIPVIGLIQVGSQAMADRYTYVPLVGIFVLIAWGIGDSVRLTRVRRAVLGGICGACIGALMAVTWPQVGYWRDSVRLFEHTLEVTSDNAPAQVFLAQTLYSQGRHEEAIAHYTEAARLQPNDLGTVYNLGLALYLEGRMEQAIGRFAHVLRIKPDHAATHLYLGSSLAQTDRFAEAIAHSKTALRINPGLKRAHYDLGMALAGTGEYEDAIHHYEQWLGLDPSSADTHFRLGDAHLSLGRLEQAAVHYAAGLRIRPDDAEAAAKLAEIRSGQGDRN
ncbi:MAG: tetratricopeptide repeat protein [Phycisphaerales bacterium]|nr:MAG: tetratricopeptide repeat protein [Phycisphaerales bacterium]